MNQEEYEKELQKELQQAFDDWMQASTISAWLKAYRRILVFEYKISILPRGIE